METLTRQKSTKDARGASELTRWLCGSKPNVLIACEYSGIVREAFNAVGFNAISCDKRPTEKPGKHVTGDVTDYLSGCYICECGWIFSAELGKYGCANCCGEGETALVTWDAMIAHPPCTRLTNSVWWYILKHDLHDEVEKAAGFFLKLWNAPIPCIGIENPIPNKGAREYLPHYNQIIQPWQFGDDASKATCLWLKNLPPLLSMQFCEPDRWADGKPRWSNQTDGGWNKMGPSEDRSKERARFWPGVAKAMAEQWKPTILDAAV